MYETPDPGDALTQGDIVDGCPIFSLDQAAPDEPNPVPRRYRERVVVLTQACDLAQDKTSRVVVANVRSCEDLVVAGLMKKSTIKDQVRLHKMPGWYFLPKSDGPMTLPESIVNLRDLHTVPRAILEGLAARGGRIGGVCTPWREHLAQHFGISYMRIGLPEPYETEP